MSTSTRIFFIATVLLFLGVAGYAYSKNPEGCWKVIDDLGALFHSISPFQAESTPAAQPQPEEVQTPTAAATAVAAPAPLPPSPPKKWTPPDVIPSQPNWTWTTSDNKTYVNVTINDIKPDVVTITHSMGVSRVDISTLPPDIQKKLNYDPDAAAFTKAESARESDHPYYPVTSLADAQSVARQLHWPLAWMCSDLSALTVANPPIGSEEDLTQMALNHLKSQTVVIFLNGDADLPALSPIIRDQQFFQLDDGPLPDGHHFNSPKIVFSDADVTTALGRVSQTQMAASREVAIDTVLQSIANDPAAQALLNGQPGNTSTATTTPAPTTVAPSPTSATSSPAPDTSSPAPTTSSPPSATPSPTSATPSPATPGSAQN
ncbi:MAG: hypothetical protein LV481_04080 [Methylacidiphilales bacterium]|nr:hypothetical protein [Candidatus Methylacidiphilales bacterium]